MLTQKISASGHVFWNAKPSRVVKKTENQRCGILPKTRNVEQAGSNMGKKGEFEFCLLSQECWKR